MAKKPEKKKTPTPFFRLRGMSPEGELDIALYSYGERRFQEMKGELTKWADKFPKEQWHDSAKRLVKNIDLFLNELDGTPDEDPVF